MWVKATLIQVEHFYDNITVMDYCAGWYFFAAVIWPYHFARLYKSVFFVKKPFQI